MPLPPAFPINDKTTSISDENGNLLFAFNGNKIIDRNLAVMPSLVNVNLQGVKRMLIQQIPGSFRYYVFYLKENVPTGVNASYTILYAIVDLTLNGGLGDVTEYNQIINTSSSPAFTLSQGDDPNKSWLIVHRHATDSFYAYQVTNAGLNTTPVKSRAGTNLTLTDYIFRDLKTSFNGKMIAGVTYRDYTVLFATTYSVIETYNFDAVTGILTYKVRTPRTYGYFFNYLSLEFSPDNRLLYLCTAQRIFGLQPCGFGNGTIYQYNLCYTDSIEFWRYSYTVATDFQRCLPTQSWGEIQMGADKRIQVPFSGTPVSAINTPNRIGSHNGYVFNSYQLPNSNSANVASPMFPHKLMEKAVKNNIVYDGGCHPNPIVFSVTNDTITAIQWNFGDAGSADNTSGLLSPSHVFSAPGIYTVTAQLYNSQNNLIETLTELVEIKDPNKRLLDGYPADTTFCAGGGMGIKLDVVNGIYQWFRLWPDGTLATSTIGDSIFINTTDKWYVRMKQNDCNGCTKLDSINVTVLPKPNFGLGIDRTLCSGDSIRLVVPDNNAQCIWNTGATTNAIWVRQGGLYWVQAEYNNNGCPVRDSIVITAIPGVSFSLPDDVTLCNTQTLLLNPGVPNANYLWQNGSTQTTFTVTQPGKYWVRITNANSCTKTDTINVSYINASQVYLGKDTALCTGSSLLLQSNILNASYTWSTGATSNQIMVTQPGSYWIKVDNGTCTVADTIDVSFDTPPSLFLGNDQTLCKGVSLLLNPGITNASYKWKDGSTNNTFTVTQPGNYWVEIKKNSCIVKDTIDINYYTVPSINLGADTRFCTGDSITLDAGSPFIQYAWSNGSNAQKIKVHASGEYSVIAITNDNCPSKDTIRILDLYELPVIDLGNNNQLCNGESRVLHAGSGFSQYAWNTGSSTPTITINNTGSYSVIITDNNGCKNYDTLNIDTILPVPAGFLGKDSSICSYGTMILMAAGNYKNYQWNNGSTSPTLSITQPGTYWLQVKDINNCTGKDTVLVALKDCMQGLYVPSGFTPNHDGKNDLLQPFLFGTMQQYQFTIYDRMGNIVFRSSTPAQGWDGNYKGQPQNSAVFVWTCIYQLSGETAKSAKGTLVLIR